ncbi:MAG: hypothetical protein NVSMB43_26110 [Pseudarthrobacter sp.]
MTARRRRKGSKTPPMTVEKVLTGMFQPLSRQALTARWNQAVEAMAKHLEAQANGSE